MVQAYDSRLPWSRTPTTQAELDEILDKHKAFLEGRAWGQRALLVRRDMSELALDGRDLSGLDLTGASFAHAQLVGTNFKNSILFCCNLGRADLRGAILRRADLRGASLRGADLTDADLFQADMRDGAIAEKTRSGDLKMVVVDEASDMGGATLVRANLTEAKMAGVIGFQTDFTDAVMKNCSLVRADLRNAKLDGANLEGSDLQGADLRGASLKNVIMVNAKTAMAEIAGADMSGRIDEQSVGKSMDALPAMIPVLLQRHARYVQSNGAEGAPLDVSGFDLRKSDALAGHVLTGMKANGAVLVGMDLSGASLQGACFEGADLRYCNFAGADLRGANLKSARLNQAKLTGADLSALPFGSGRFFPTRLNDVQARFADFSGAKLARAVFIGADLSEADFTGADIRDAKFDLTKLDEAVGLRLPPTAIASNA